MKNFLAVSVTVIIFLFQPVCGQIEPNQTGMKLFDDWTPDKTGTTDVSDMLQEAVNYCILNSRTLYISSGTYLVSKQIIGITFSGMSCGSHVGNKAFTITGDALNRPLIKLIDGSAGFQSTDINSSLAVFLIRHEKGETAGESCNFWSIIKNIDFDLGNNPGAVAIRNPSAQDSQIANIKVYGQNFAAGFTGVPGRNAVTVNCEVIGGKYAFYIKNSLGANLFGLKCKNQSVAALYISIWRAAAITGVEISGCQGTPVICIGSDAFQGNLVLTDARIEMTNPSNFAFNINNRAIVLRNIYVKGSNNLVTGTGFTWTGTPETWTRIKSFSFTPGTINTKQAYNLINGSKNNDVIKEFEYLTSAPAGFASKHTPDKIYAFNSPGMVSVTSYGAVAGDGADDLPAFQAAINANDLVFAPAGSFNLSGPIVLKNNSVILGDPGKRTRLIPSYTPTSNTWMIITPDIEGYVAIQDLAFETPDQNYFGAVNWRTSKGFILNVRNFLAAGGSEKTKHNFEFSGNAGGKFFGVSEQSQLYNGKTPSTGFRKVFVTGTHNPMTFYGLNLERGGASGDTWQNPYFEAVNSGNIRVFGTKSETDGIVYSFSNCNNISLNTVMAHAHNPYFDPVVIELKNGTANVEINLVYCPNTSGETMISDGLGNIAKRTDFVGRFAMGTFNPDVFDSAGVTGISRYEPKPEIRISPNPTSGYVWVETNIKSIKDISLLNNCGTVIDKWSNTNSVNISKHSPGFYFLQITTGQGIKIIQKVVKT